MTDFLIIGAGIIGMMNARELVKEGASVILVDKNNCGKGASWAGGGIIAPLYPWKYSKIINELSFKSQQMYQQICAELFNTTGIDVEYIKSNMLMLDEFDSDIAQKWLKKYQIKYQTTKQGALFNVAQVRNPRILQALKKDLQISGVKIIENKKIKQLVVKNNKVLGADDLIARNTIICAGPYVNDLIISDIFPVKGEIIVIFDASKSIQNIILKNSNYIVPRKDGTILVGTTYENVGFDTTLNTAVKINLFTFATSIFPHLKKCQIIHHWCGFRPGRKINEPIIAKDDKYENLFINGGHFGNGLNTAPQNAKKMLTILKENKC